MAPIGMCAILVLMLMCCRGIVLVCSEELPESDTCSSSYKSLAATLVNDDRNFYNLQATFFPPISTKPVFVASAITCFLTHLCACAIMKLLCTYQRSAMMQAIISCFFSHNE